MITKKITYTDFNGVERTEEFNFNMTKAELAELELSYPGGFSTIINNVVNAKDVTQLAAIFKDIICRSYGIKSEDGRKFVKNRENLEDFMATEAYSELYMELATDANKAAEFINGVLPKIDQPKALPKKATK